MRWLPFRSASLVASCLAVAVLAAPACGLTLQFDYRYDGGFFTDPELYPQADAARIAIERAAKCFEPYMDQLERIEASGSNEWKAQFSRPDNDRDAEVANLVVPAETLVIFVGGRSMADDTLAMGGPGGLWIKGTPLWRDLVKYRGQYGARPAENPTDFGPWGGSVAFNTDVSWHFDADTPPGADETDFLTVATHELVHVLGFGTSASWDTWVDWGVAGWEFIGPASVAAYGDSIPLDDIYSHWADGTESLVAGVTQETIMSPFIMDGERWRLTELDRAGVQDIGWEPALIGDADHDGEVDFEDYLALKRNYGLAGSWPEGDFDYDGDVDLDDYLAGEANFGRSYSGSATPGGFAAPEPGCAAMLALGALALLGRRKHTPAAR
jgi:hypothetical protein